MPMSDPDVPARSTAPEPAPAEHDPPAESPADEAPPEADAESGPGDATSKAEEYLELLKRTRADYANFRRRVDDERATFAREANRDLVMKLLPILDDFERALAMAPAEERETGFAKGVQLIQRNLNSLLASEDVVRIEAEGAEFNPWEHEAIAHQPSADAEEGTVLHVVRTGYRRGDRVLRPAQVVVARRPD